MIKLLKNIIRINLIISLFTILSGSVNIQLAKNIAENIIAERSNSNNYIKNYFVDSNEGVDNFYIFNLEPNGFIIVAANKNIIPVIGYSFNKNINFDNLPIQLNKIFDSYRSNILFAINNNIEASYEIQNLWRKYTSNLNREQISREVPPLITANWNQGGAWNNMCPGDALVGCVAVAMSQVMYYWGHPIQAEGYSSYYHGEYGPISVNFEDYIYDYNNMEDDVATFDSQLLLYHSGVAVEMDYSSWGSGASVCWEGPSSQDALSQHFNFIDEAECNTKINYDDDGWIALIEDQLDRGWPIIYRAYGENDGPGHAWNIDGYQEGGYLHCNWGWGGSSNGYFYFNNLNGGGYNFVENQAALINVFPRGILPPMALFEYEIDEMYVNFNDLSTLINENEIVLWNWDFGDGNISFNQYPNYEYLQYGEYEVTLIVRDDYGLDSSPFSEVIVIQDLSYDLNEDSNVNVLDIIFLIDLILENNFNSDINGDINGDNQISVLDVILLVSLILNN